MIGTADLTMSSANYGARIICGIAPRVRISTLNWRPCWNCKAIAVVQTFSGSGWYEDDFLCSHCGENCGENSSGYRPFQRGWRKRNITHALALLETGIPLDEYRAQTMALISYEMQGIYA